MKPIPRHTHSIELEFTNISTKLLCFRLTLPMNKKKYSVSRWYKTMKPAIASSENVPVWQIKGKHSVIKCEHEERILFEWPGGISLNVPADATDYDYEIILAQLEVLKMSREKR